FHRSDLLIRRSLYKGDPTDAGSLFCYHKSRENHGFRPYLPAGTGIGKEGKTVEQHRILIIEDDRKIASLLAETLRKYHYNVRTAAGFDRSVAAEAECSPLLILLDISRPSSGGYYWCRQLRQRTTVPILFISARSGEMDQVFALENGGDDFITKPFNYEIVLA